MIRKPAKRKTTKRATVKRVRNPDKLLIVDNFGGRPYLSDIQIWMIDYMKKNPNYDPGVMAYKAKQYFHISDYDSQMNMEKLAFDLAEEFEYNKERSRQRKASVKTKGFPLGLGNAPFKKKNPDGQIKPRGITLDEIKTWMIKYIKSDDDYDPTKMANDAIIHLNIRVTPEERKIIIKHAFKVADEYEMNRKR